MDGSRTHRSSQRDPPPVLKTGEPTGTQPLPSLSILHGFGFVNDDDMMMVSQPVVKCFAFSNKFGFAWSAFDLTYVPRFSRIFFRLPRKS